MLTFIPTPIGNVEDITLRALKYFEKTTLFLCEDTRVTKKLLRLLEERHGLAYPSNANFLSFNEHNGAKRLGEVQSRLKSEEVVFVSDAGMPAISDPGQLLVAFCQKEGIDYDVLPGASALSVAYAACGFEGSSFLFGAFLPHKSQARISALAGYLQSGYHVALYEAPHRLLQLLQEITSLDAQREIFLAKEISKQHQAYYIQTAKTLLETFGSTTIKGEWVVIIKAKEASEKTLSFTEVMQLDLPPKVKAKLLAKLSEKSTTEWYEELTSAK